MKKLALLLLGVLFVSACMGKLPEVPTLENVQIPVVAEDVIWSDADYEGKPILVVFMGSWCPWCKRTMPALNAIAEKYGDQIEIVGAFMDQTPGPVRDALLENQLNVKALFNASDVAEGLGVNGLPHAFLFDKKHRAVKMWEGYSPNLEQEFDEAVKRVL